MTVQVQVSETIERPVATVFRFYVHDHVRNHPRWDPDMSLEQITVGPIGMGTIIRRRNTHFTIPVEGTMEVVEFVPDRAFAVVIHDGPAEAHGRVTFVSEGPAHTRLTISAEFLGMDESMKPTISGLIGRTMRNIKQLIESET